MKTVPTVPKLLKACASLGVILRMPTLIASVKRAAGARKNNGRPRIYKSLAAVYPGNASGAAANRRLSRHSAPHANVALKHEA